jgi:hypothetical protein
MSANFLQYIRVDYYLPPPPFPPFEGIFFVDAVDMRSRVTCNRKSYYVIEILYNTRDSIVVQWSSTIILILITPS